MPKGKPSPEMVRCFRCRSDTHGSLLKRKDNSLFCPFCGSVLNPFGIR